MIKRKEKPPKIGFEKPPRLPPEGVYPPIRQIPLKCRPLILDGGSVRARRAYDSKFLCPADLIETNAALKIVDPPPKRQPEPWPSLSEETGTTAFEVTVTTQFETPFVRDVYNEHWHGRHPLNILVDLHNRSIALRDAARNCPHLMTINWTSTERKEEDRKRKILDGNVLKWPKWDGDPIVPGGTWSAFSFIERARLKTFEETLREIEREKGKRKEDEGVGIDHGTLRRIAIRSARG